MEANLNLRERARVAWEAQERKNRARLEAEEAALEAQRAAEEAPILQEKLRSILGIEMVVSTRRVTLDGMQFGVEYSYGEKKLRAYPHCPACGRHLRTVDVEDWANVGFAFAQQTISKCYGCVQKEQDRALEERDTAEPTPDEAFLTAFRTWLEAEREATL